MLNFEGTPEDYTAEGLVADMTDDDVHRMLATVPASAIGSPLHKALIDRAYRAAR